MAKSLCKYRRVEIAAQFAAITRIVSAPKYICTSCARAASDKAYLCKPSAIPLKRVQTANVPPAKITAEADPIQPIQVNSPAVGGAALGKKKIRKLKKLAKKKVKKFKQATKALKRYNAALEKAEIELSIRDC